MRWPHLRYYAALSKFVQFVEDRVRLLECSPASCQVLRNQREEKHEKFITTNCLPLVLTNAGTGSNFEKPTRVYFCVGFPHTLSGAAIFLSLFIYLYTRAKSL